MKAIIDRGIIDMFGLSTACVKLSGKLQNT